MNENQRLILAIVLIMGIFAVSEWVVKPQFFPVPESAVADFENELAEPKESDAKQKTSAIAADAQSMSGSKGGPSTLPALPKEPLPAEVRELDGESFAGEINNGVPSLNAWRLKDYQHYLSKEQLEALGLDDSQQSPEPRMNLSAGEQMRMVLQIGEHTFSRFEFKPGASESNIILVDQSMPGMMASLHIEQESPFATRWYATLTHTAEQPLAEHPFVNQPAQLSYELSYPIAKAQSGGFFGGLFGGGASGGQTLSGLCLESGDSAPTRKAANALSEAFTNEAPSLWAGIDWGYFVALVSLDDANTSVGSGPSNGLDADCRIEQTEDRVLIRFASAPKRMSDTGVLDWNHVLYAGPKLEPQMEQAHAGFGKAIDYGWFAFLARPLLFLLRAFYDATASWGWAIILLTVVVKLAMFPITYRSGLSMKKLSLLQPEMKAIRERFGNDPQRQQQEIMKLYQKSGANPLGGCLPMLLQMPIWLALYRTLWTAVDLYQQPFLWLTDLTAQESGVPILAIAAALLMLGQQLVTPMAADNQQAQIMRWVFPGIFFFILLAMPAGLALYISVNSVLSIGQQFIINRSFEAEQSKKQNGNSGRNNSGLATA